jgi:hypothetical protein
MDNISLVKIDDIYDKIQKIIRQTDYSQDKAGEKLKEHNFNEILVIQEYFGITAKKPTVIKSVNQEIYKQLRNKLDTSVRDYNVRVDKGEAKKII